MITKTIQIQNRVGLHSKPASLFVQSANHFSSDIYLTKGATRVNAKSIMGVMILAVDQGDEIVLEISGDDEEAAAEKLIQLIENHFGMDD